MAIYGNYAKNMSMVEEKSITIDGFLDFLAESDLQTMIMFEKADFITVLKEDNLLLTDKSGKTDGNDSEKVRKNIIQTVKDLIKKFIDAVKNLFQNLSEKLTEAYNKINFVDDYVSKYAKDVNYTNLTTAKTKGWKGIHESIPMVYDTIDLEDSVFFRQLTDASNPNFINESEIDEIISSKSLDEAKEKYNEFNKKVIKIGAEYKALKLDSDLSYQSSLLRLQSSLAKLTGKYAKKPLVVPANIEDGYYFPDKELFAKTKNFAENGQKIIKDVKNSYKPMINNIKLDQKVDLSNMKSYKSGGVNATDDKETNQINILYYKAKYKYSSYFLQRCTDTIKYVVAMYRSQHLAAIRFYVECVKTINKYVPADSKY